MKPGVVSILPAPVGNQHGSIHLYGFADGAFALVLLDDEKAQGCVVSPRFAKAFQSEFFTRDGRPKDVVSVEVLEPSPNPSATLPVPAEGAEPARLTASPAGTSPDDVSRIASSGGFFDREAAKEIRRGSGRYPRLKSRARAMWGWLSDLLGAVSIFVLLWAFMFVTGG